MATSHYAALHRFDTDTDIVIRSTEVVGGGAEALPSVWQAPFTQECPHQDAKGRSTPPIVFPSDSYDHNRIANILTRAIMHSPKQAWHLRMLSALRSPIPKSHCLFILSAQSRLLTLSISIPHASSTSNGHQSLSISPTNPTSPMNKVVLGNNDHVPVDTN
jgi:hypothetical protein